MVPRAPKGDNVPEVVSGIADRLRKTFESGHTRPLDWRRSQLRAMGEMLKHRGDDIVAALRADLSKPEVESRLEVAVPKSEVSLALRKLKSWTRPERVGVLPLPGRQRIIREPRGVVLIIGPWNVPVEILVMPLVGAVAAGNCVVLKPSEVSAHSSALMARIVPEYLDPEGIAVVEGGVDETTALLEQKWDYIFYTGGGAVGRVVAEAAAKQLTPVTLELGGKSPCIVDDDVDLDAAARRIAWGKWLNAGQICIAPDYVLVKREREEELVTALARIAKEFFGEDPQASPDFARIINSRHHERVARLLENGKTALLDLTVKHLRSEPSHSARRPK